MLDTQKAMEHTAYIGLGSNLGTRQHHLHQALHALQQHPAIAVTTCSSVYESAPLAELEQPSYLNAVAELKTKLNPWSLLRAIQNIELENGRIRNERWAPRTLDLDILLFADWSFSDQLLILPHPGVYMRNFVLMPLMEIAPGLLFPDQTTVKQRAQECPQDPICKLAADEFQLTTSRK